MKSFKKLSAFLAFGLLLVGIVFATNTNLFAQSGNLITANSVGPVRLGMTVDQARRAMSGYQFRRASDGEGIALIEVRRRNRTYMTLYAGEEDPQRPIDNNAQIEQIEVWSSIYRTAQGVYPRMRLRDVARVYGTLEEIMKSEIESREYATFANQPDYLGFRVQAFVRDAGIYPRGQNKTTRASSTAYIFSIIISQRPSSGDGGGSTAGFSSQVTDFNKDCKTPDGQNDDSGRVSSFCKGYGKYRLHVFDTASTIEINAETDKEAEIFHITSQSLSFDIERRQLEWRMADGKPFAVIMQADKYRTNQNGLIAYPQTVVGSHYIVKGLEGYEEIDYTVDVTRERNLLEKARKMADDAYLKKNPSKGGGTTGGNTSFQNVDINQINQTIDRAARSNQPWVKSPMQILVRVAGEFDEVKNRTIQMSSPSAESSDSIMVTITNDGLLDDSVGSERYMYRLDKTASGVWKVTSAQKAWKCQPNRGHQDFSAVPCN
jgi:hypothetical protein